MCEKRLETKLILPSLQNEATQYTASFRHLEYQSYKVWCTMAAVFRFSRLVSPTTGSFTATCRRNIGVTAVLEKNKSSDPIQKLFVEKLQEYKKKSQASGGELVDFSAEKKARVEVEKQQIRKRFGEGNLEEFPKFDFATK